jgi:hypothetical protein
VLTLPTLRLLKPVTNDAKLFTVETSRKYAVAFADADQFAEIDEQATLLPAAAVGVAGVAGNVAYVIADELALVPHELLARTR